MERFRETRQEIKKLASEEIGPTECKEGIIKLDEDLDNYFDNLPIQKFNPSPSRNYYYFWTVKYDYKKIPGKKSNILQAKLGRILKSDYKKYEKEIIDLMKKRDKLKIKEFLEPY